MEERAMTPTRVAFVTGGGGAIGSAIAHRLARRGVQVAVNDTDSRKADAVAASVRSKTGAKCLPAVADVRVESQISAAVHMVNEQLGPVTILVHCAGVLRNAPLEDMDDDTWTSLVDVHLRGAYVTARATIGTMKAAGWGRIVTISSVAARGSNRGHTNYSAAKAGLIGLTKTLAVEHGPFGITANVVAPGAIRSDMTYATAQQLGISFEEYERGYAERSPRRRIGEPEEVANAVDFFISEESDLITGQVLFVAGAP
jgi:3-oxoacyl-[acyl-carrier protein] reductase